MRKLPSGMRLDLSRARRESSEGAEAGALPGDCLWLDRDAAGIMVATLHLLSQWLLQAPQACRQAETPSRSTLQPSWRASITSVVPMHRKGCCLIVILHQQTSQTRCLRDSMPEQLSFSHGRAEKARGRPVMHRHVMKAEPCRDYILLNSVSLTVMGFMCFRQEAFEELGQSLVRALTSPLLSVQQAARSNKDIETLQSSG